MIKKNRIRHIAMAPPPPATTTTITFNSDKYNIQQIMQ